MVGMTPPWRIRAAVKDHNQAKTIDYQVWDFTLKCTNDALGRWTAKSRLAAALSGCFCLVFWLRELDLNQRPSGYEPDELPGCSIPRLCVWRCFALVWLIVIVVWFYR
jgi:hypothetical protein